MPRHSVVEQRLARTLPSTATWVPLLEKCLAREQQLPTWADLGTKLYMFCEKSGKKDLLSFFRIYSHMYMLETMLDKILILPYAAAFSF